MRVFLRTKDAPSTTVDNLAFVHNHLWTSSARRDIANLSVSTSPQALLMLLFFR